MNWLVQNVWCIPLLPLLAAGIIALLPRRARRAGMTLAIGSMIGGLILSTLVFASTLGIHQGETGAEVRTLNFHWLDTGSRGVPLGFLLDPLAAIMLVMVSLVGLLIFIYSAGYMAQDSNVTRFFGFLSLFAAAMLGLVIANSLLLLFVCWELMGVASYLLIGFWFHKPSAAAAAKKAFIVTRIGDLGLFLGMLWLYSETGTLLFYDGGNGALEPTALAAISGRATGTLSAGMAISLLIFVGAVGKSGQVPLHVWLPDAMEGPTPVSALIHAATMVAAGVFLVARVFPLMTGGAESVAAGDSIALQAVTWVGAITAVFAALIAVGQDDIKRILAYSTVSQLGYMFLGLGTGGIAVGMFHLITHAFFKALLFLGAGSVIHGCHDVQDIRHMGGLRRMMPITFATYAIGMMALAGVPLFFSGFWSKDEILHTAWLWNPSRIPFVLGLVGAFLTAFYMTRQMGAVFFGEYRGGYPGETHETQHLPSHKGAHESPAVMTLPLIVLAVFAVLLGFLGTPAWPWFESYLAGHAPDWAPERLSAALPMMLLSTAVVALGIGLGWLLYVRRPRELADDPDALEARLPDAFGALRDRLYIDQIYNATIVQIHRGLSALMAWLDTLVIGGLVLMVGFVFQGLAMLSRWIDEWIVNAGFDAGCQTMRFGGRLLSRLQGGRAQRYLASLALGMVLLTLALVWGIRG